MLCGLGEKERTRFRKRRKKKEKQEKNLIAAEKWVGGDEMVKTYNRVKYILPYLSRF